MKFLLNEMSWPEAQEYFAKSNIVILPVGSNEQHGPASKTTVSLSILIHYCEKKE